MRVIPGPPLQRWAKFGLGKDKAKDYPQGGQQTFTAKRFLCQPFKGARDLNTLATNEPVEVG